MDASTAYVVVPPNPDGVPPPGYGYTPGPPSGAPGPMPGAAMPAPGMPGAAAGAMMPYVPAGGALIPHNSMSSMVPAAPAQPDFATMSMMMAMRDERSERQERAERAERADRLAQQTMLQSNQTMQATLASMTSMSSNVANASIAATGAVASAVLGSSRQQLEADGKANLTITMPDGSEYVGHTRGGKPHGEGHMDYPGSTAVLPGYPDALATLSTEDGTGAPLVSAVVPLHGGDYEGEWVHGERHGKGRLRFKGTPFKQLDGIWVDDMPCGQCTLTYRDGSRAKGDFRDGMLWGAGELERMTQTGERWFTYTGNFVRGRPEGKGTLRVLVPVAGGGTDTLTVDGDFRAGAMVRGSVKFPAGDPQQRARYDGELKDLLPPVPNGTGDLHYQNGDRYYGLFSNSKRQGKGVFTWTSEGRVYDGEWTADVIHGKGRMIFGPGQAYDVRVPGDGRPPKPQTGPGLEYNGEFVGGVFEGKGVYSSRQFTYTGGFKGGKLHGHGTRIKYDIHRPGHVVKYRLTGDYDNGRTLSESGWCSIM